MTPGSRRAVVLGAGLTRRTPVISLAKGHVAPDGTAPTVLLSTALGANRVACIGGSLSVLPGNLYVFMNAD
jgi:hypothetical protein